jgi:hypothetical protein
MTDYDIHSCSYYCNRPACIEAQRNELRDKLFEIRTSERNIQTSDKETPESSQPTEPTIDGWPLYSGLPPIKVQDKTFEEFAQSFAQRPQPDGVALTPIEHPHLGKPSKYKLSKESLETVVLEKEWVGLTDDERYLNDGRTEEEIEYAKAIEAKLKEKNA